MRTIPTAVSWRLICAIRPVEIERARGVAAVVPGDHARGNDGARAGDEPGEAEERRDHDDASPRGVERRLVVEEVDHGVEKHAVT